MVAGKTKSGDSRMSDVVNAELLRICDDVLDGIPTSDETLGHIKDVCTLARALKSRLQAEAQAPTTAASVLTEEDHDFIARQRVNCYDQYNTRAETVENFLSIIDRLTVGAPAPKLQEDSAHHAGNGSTNEGIGVGTIASLPPVAPAPAPTMPTRDTLARAHARATQADGVSDEFWDQIKEASASRRAKYPTLWKDTVELAFDTADAVIAKGDTP
jgi:hypothetical protein